MCDAELIAEFLRTENADLFRELVERYQDRVFRLVASVMGPYRDVEAEDVSQEVFLQVYLHLASFRSEAKFGSWLYRIAYRRALDRREAARIRLPHVSDEAIAGHAAAGLDPLGEALRGEDRRRVVEAIEGLSDLYRTLIYLYYWQEVPVDEIAVYTGVPAGTEKSYLARARQQIERRLAR